MVKFEVKIDPGQPIDNQSWSKENHTVFRKFIQDGLHSQCFVVQVGPDMNKNGDDDNDDNEEKDVNDELFQLHTSACWN